jgi:hypothetical protein
MFSNNEVKMEVSQHKDVAKQGLVRTRSFLFSSEGSNRFAESGKMR